MNHELLLQILGPLGAALGAYVGVRVELATLRVRVERVESEMRLTNQRIDHLSRK